MANFVIWKWLCCLFVLGCVRVCVVCVFVLDVLDDVILTYIDWVVNRVGKFLFNFI